VDKVINIRIICKNCGAHLHFKRLPLAIFGGVFSQLMLVPIWLIFSKSYSFSALSTFIIGMLFFVGIYFLPLYGKSNKQRKLSR